MIVIWAVPTAILSRALVASVSTIMDNEKLALNDAEHTKASGDFFTNSAKGNGPNHG